MDEVLQSEPILNKPIEKPIYDDVAFTKELSPIEKIEPLNDVNLINSREWERTQILVDKINELTDQVNILIRYLKKK